MANAPIQVRYFVKSAGADADFALTQVSPAASLLVSATGINTIAVSFVAYTSAGAVSTGTLDLQLVKVNTPRPEKGLTLVPLITGSAVDTNVAIGAELTYTITGNASYCIRVANVAGLAGAVSYCRIFARPIT